MRVREQFRDGMLMLSVAERALVRRPDWEQIAGLERADATVVTLNLADVDFVSSLFLQGCAELSGRLAERGSRLALLHLSPSQKALLDLIDGASDLLVELLGEDGRHARTATGAAQLPFGACVQLDLVLRLADPDEKPK